MHAINRLILVVAVMSGCSKPTAPVPTEKTSETSVAPSGAAAPTVVAAAGVGPRFDPTGTRLVFASGVEGQRDITVLDAEGNTRAFEQPGDDIDPTWTPDGRIVFSSNRDGDYDLWVLDLSTDASPQQLTDGDGDEVEPTVAPILFGFYAVQNGMCGSPASGRLLQEYQKVLFTKRAGDASEVWFTSLDPAERTGEARFRTTHTGLISASGERCGEPFFGGDGLSALYVCDGIVKDAQAKYAPSFQAALDALESDEPPAECRGWDDDLVKCVSALERRYAEYPGQAVSTAADGLRKPAVSANEILLIAQTDDGLMIRPRYQQAPWKPLDVGAESPRGPVWSPTGKEIAFSSTSGVQRAETNFYLQSVRNLHRFPELFGDGQSERLQNNRFVVRPADHKEFYILHDKLRYDERPQFISADVALQIFRDEFLRLIEKAETEAADAIRKLSFELMNHFVERFERSKKPIDRYYAVLFAVGWAPLEAAATLERPDSEDLMMARMDPDGSTPEEKSKLDALTRPVAERLPQQLPKVVSKVPESIRQQTRRHLERVLQHSGIEEVSIPGLSKTFKIDFSQFKIRGAYAENDLGGYFLAMNWFAEMPLPIEPSLGVFTFALQSKRVDGKTLLQHWQRVDAMVGSFMGRPVDATVQHVVDELKGKKKFNEKALRRTLADLRGPISIRDANGPRQLHVTLFPKRMGLDVSFFRALTHPKVKGRGMPSSLDVFATLGNERARHHAAGDAGEMSAQYLAALEQLAGRTPAPDRDKAYWSTDIYHSWLAALAVLAGPVELDDDLMLEFTRNNAWKDRKLYSALAGYTQLKHSAVLYARQDIGVQCGDESSYYVAVERPIVPRPRGFVEPNVEFYESLARLARRAYTDILNDPLGPNANRWAAEEDPRMNAANFMDDLAAIARAEATGKPLTDEQNRFIEYIGGRLETLTIMMEPTSYSYSTGGDGRAERGVALATDIHTNKQRQQALQIAIGRIFDMWVVVPSEVGQRLTQGGILSFYEFPQPMSNRLTDAEWGERVDSGQLPARPGWTSSFIEGE